MEAQNIKARIAIGRDEAGDIAYIYDFNLIKSLNVPPDKFFTNSAFFDIGTEIEIQEQTYRIKKIRTVFYNKTFDMSNPPGVNVYGIGKLLDFNFEVLYFVEDV